jgi:hypothetical protein
MKEKSNHPIKNNCLSSGFLQFEGLYNIHDDNINGQSKGNKESVINPNQQKLFSQTNLNNNISLSLSQFMENQDKKHLSTNFNHKDVKKFLKEKDKAMEKIVFEDDSLDENDKTDNEENEERNKSKKEDRNKSIKLNKENDENKNNSKNENNNILIFHGTFGEDKCNEIMNIAHHHRHSHHHHHHHHHHQDSHKLESQNGNGNKSKFAFEY